MMEFIANLQRDNFDNQQIVDKVVDSFLWIIRNV